MKKLLGLSLLALGLGVNIHPAYASSAEVLDNFYLGAGMGNSWLEPNVNNSVYSLDDSTDFGFKLLAGYDLSERLGLELSYVNLGTAALSMGTEKIGVDYTTSSLAGLFHVLGERSKSLFIKAGMATLDASSSVEIDVLHDYQLMLGFGGEWAIKDDWSLRAEFESFDEDAKIATLSVIKRFQSQSPVTVNETVKICSDVISAVDTDCYIPPVAQQQDDCRALTTEGVNGIHFELNSAELVAESIPVLNNVVSVLETCPSIVLEIQAYSDSTGKEKDNLSLSSERAHEVKLYLASRGISPPRLVAMGYGQANPIASNRTKAGQALNRRVDFQILRIISAY